MMTFGQTSGLGLNTIAGFSSSLQLNPTASDDLPYFAWISSRGPASSALVGQAATHMGCLPSAHLSRQKPHFCIFALSSAPNCGAPYGQASRHGREQSSAPRHSSLPTTTTPSVSLLLIAPAGQTSTHAGSAQWLQLCERKATKSSGYRPFWTVDTRRQLAGPAGMSCQFLHATVHV
jgi:hypothetical protein